MSKTKARVDDQMWKAILEDTFADFLRFFFPDEIDQFDLEKGFEYLDKEFETLFPPEPHNKGVRFVDKLIKVYLKNGDSKFILVHVEAQLSKGKGDLSRRMFDYCYKILDKYDVPITAVAILLDTNKSYRPKEYTRDFLGTSISYKFNSYKVMDQDESLLRSDPNPFAVVVLTALLDIKNRKASDDKLLSIKHDLYDEMMKRKMNRNTRHGIYDFLKYYVSFQNDEKMSIFDSQVKDKLGRSDTMGMQEYLLEKAKNTGLNLGLQKGRLALEKERARAEAEKRDVVRNLVNKFENLSDDSIATLAVVSVDLVKDVRKELNQNPEGLYEVK